MHACAVVCCPTLKNSKPCETPTPTPVILGCSKCLFMLEVGERAGAGGSQGGARLAEFETLPGKALQEELVSGLRRDLHFVFDQKKGEGGAVRGMPSL